MDQFFLQAEQKYIRDCLARYDITMRKENYWALTPIEHLFLGSTCPGILFQPNKPLPMANNASLAEVNDFRRKKICRFCVLLENESSYIQLDVVLKKLSPRQIEARVYKKTFKILRAFDADGRRIWIPRKIHQLLAQRIERGCSAAKMAFKKDCSYARA